LTVNGDIANYQILLSQNATFKQAYINGQVSFSDYQTAMAFQTGILQQLLALNLVTAAQYQAIMDAQTIVPSNGDETGNTDIGGGNNNSGSTLPSVTVGGFNVLPLIAILTGVICLALAYWYFFKRRIPQ
jgi:ABC-type transport system involved in multi-copper enzyme maturation permease subunit